MNVYVSEPLPEVTDDTRDVPNGLIRSVSLILAVVPFLAVGILYFFAWQTSRSFGEWPTYGTPDPKDANSTLYAMSMFSILAALPAAVTLAVWLAAARRLRLQRDDFWVLLVAVVGLVALWLVLTGDLGTWLAD